MFFWIGNQISSLFGWSETEEFLRNLEPSVTDKAIIDTFFWYVVVIIVQTIVLIVWALSNQLRFRGKERRRSMRAIDTDDLGALYEFPPSEIARWQGTRSMTMHHDPNGKLIETNIIDNF